MLKEESRSANGFEIVSQSNEPFSSSRTHLNHEPNTLQP
jgi:hypothetical protein